jgi:hypothetical protein
MESMDAKELFRKFKDVIQAIKIPYEVIVIDNKNEILIKNYRHKEYGIYCWVEEDEISVCLGDNYHTHISINEYNGIFTYEEKIERVIEEAKKLIIDFMNNKVALVEVFKKVDNTAKYIKSYYTYEENSIEEKTDKNILVKLSRWDEN